jgi:hypothetical protein
LIYRDPLAEVRARVAERRADVEAKKKALGPLRRAVVSADALAAIEALDAATDAFDDASLRAIADRLDELAERLDRALDASHELLADVGSPDLPEATPRSLRWGTPVDVHDEVAAALPDAELADWGALATGARFRREGVDLFLLASRTERGLASFNPDDAGVFSLVVAVGVPRALPAFRFDPRGRASGDLAVARLLVGEPSGAPDYGSLASHAWDARDLARLPDAITVLVRLRQAIDAARPPAPPARRH